MKIIGFEKETHPHTFTHILRHVIHNIEDKRERGIMECAVANMLRPYDQTTLDCVSSKYKILERQKHNPFINEKVYERYIGIFGKAQRKYQWLRKFIQHIKLKKIKLINTTTLLGETFNESNISKMHTIVCNKSKSKYIFTLNELVNIIEKALGNADEWFICEPMWPKNPYNRVNFTTEQLYYIYFRVRYVNLNIPLDVFYLKHESVLKRNAILQYVKHSPNKYLSSEIYKMLYACELIKNGKYLTNNIDLKFPNDILVEIFRPYLHLWNNSIYDICAMVREKSLTSLITALHVFWKNNPAFGRKILKFYRDKNGKRICKYDFNTKNTPLHLLNTKNIIVQLNYRNSTLTLFDFTICDMQ